MPPPWGLALWSNDMNKCVITIPHEYLLQYVVCTVHVCVQTPWRHEKAVRATWQPPTWKGIQYEIKRGEVFVNITFENVTSPKPSDHLSHFPKNERSEIYFEEDNNHLVTTFAGVNFLDGITQCNCDMDVKSCFSRFFVKLFPYFPTSAFTKIEIKVVGSTMKGGASPWLFSHSISSFEYKVASTTCQEIKKKYFLYAR